MKFVDLKLPSGLLWSTTNLGAEDPCDSGARFTESEANVILDSIKSTPFRFPTFKEWAELKRCLIEAKYAKFFGGDITNVFTTIDRQLIIPCNGYCWPNRGVDFGYWCEHDDPNAARRLVVARDWIGESREWAYNIKPRRNEDSGQPGIRLVANSCDILDMVYDKQIY